MRTYKLNKRITIQKETTDKNTLGTPNEDYSDLKTTWATVSYRGGAMGTNEYGEIANTDAEFTVRYDTRINYKCRIVYQGEYYKIQHIEVIGNNEGLRMKTIHYKNEFS